MRNGHIGYTVLARTHVRQVREAQFLFAGELIRGDAGIRRAVAYNVTADA